MVFPVEFDFGVPQFRMIFGPMLIMLAAGVALTATRMWLGRGAAIGAVAFFLLVRGIVSVIVGPVLGETTPHFALFIVEGLVVEAVFLALPRARPLTLGPRHRRRHRDDRPRLRVGVVEHLDAHSLDLRPPSRGRRSSASSPRWADRSWASGSARASPRTRCRGSARRETAPSPAPPSWRVLVGFAAFKPAAEGVSARRHAGRSRPGRGRPDRTHVADRRRGRRRVHQRHRRGRAAAS